MRSYLVISSSCILWVIKVGERDRHQHECLTWKNDAADADDAAHAARVFAFYADGDAGER